MPAEHKRLSERLEVEHCGDCVLLKETDGNTICLSVQELADLIQWCWELDERLRKEAQ